MAVNTNIVECPNCGNKIDLYTITMYKDGLNEPEYIFCSKCGTKIYYMQSINIPPYYFQRISK